MSVNELADIGYVRWQY